MPEKTENILGSIIPLVYEKPVYGPRPEGYFPRPQTLPALPLKRFFYVLWEKYYDYPPAGRGITHTEALSIDKHPLVFRAKFNKDMEDGGIPDRIGKILFWSEISEEEHLLYEEETG